MDCFYAQVEVLDDPDLKGRPVIVGGTSARGVVCSASYEARRFGVRSAMPILKARLLCPQGVFLPVRMNRYREVSAQIMDLLAAFAPVVEPISVDEAYLDLTGTGQLYGSAEEMGRRIKSLIKEKTQLTCSVGLGPNRLLAKIASELNKPDGLVVVSAAEAADFLANLDVSRLPGVGPKLAQRLHTLNLKRIADLRRLGQEEAVRFFGAIGSYLVESAWGRDQTPVQPPGEPKSISAEETLEQDSNHLDDLLSHLADQALRVGRRLRRRGLLARTVCLKLKRHDFSLITRAKSLAEPTDETRLIFQTAASLLKANHRGQLIRLVGLGVSGLSPAQGRQAGLFDPEKDQTRRARLDQAVDEIISRFGPEAIRLAISLKND